MTTADVEAPRWFREAVAVEAEGGSVTVEGCPIAYRRWPSSGGGTGIVLVHGGAAHARWWDHLAPQLAVARPVVAFDLSGHGDSGWRSHYSIDLWAREARAVAQLCEARILVGHSMGGLVTLRASALDPHDVNGVITIDSPFGQYQPEDQAVSERLWTSARRTYDTRAAAAGRFRPVPPQRTLPYVERHVAETSVRETDTGWTWKWDPHVFDDFQSPARALDGVTVPVTYIVAEHGMVSPGMRAAVTAQLGPGVPQPWVAEAGHHVMLDQPLALLEILSNTLADWDRGS